MAFNTPTTVDRGATTLIEFVVAPDQSVKQLKKQISKAGRREGARVQLSNYMEADLTGTNFVISRVGSEPRKLVLPGHTTHWAWEITPKRTGQLQIHLSLIAILRAQDDVRELEVRTFERTLSIRVSWPVKTKDFLKDNWQWLWTAVLAPLGLWAAQRTRQSKTKGMDGPPPAT